MEKIIHQIWIGPYKIPKLEEYFSKIMKEKNPDFEYMLWTNDNLPEMPEVINKKIDFWANDPVYGESYAAVADIIRIVVVKKYGGIYADIDWQCHKGFNDLNLENYDGLIVHHDDYTSGNEFFGSKKGGFIDDMYENLLVREPSYPHFPWWFNDEIRKYSGVPNTWNRENFTSEEFDNLSQQWIKNLNDKNILTLRKWGQFENIYLTHQALFSHDYKHREYFKQGNSDYQETVYNIKIKGYND